MLVYKDKTSKLKIKKLIMMDEEYTNVETELNAETLKKAIENDEVIEIFVDNKSIFLRSTYIMSYEL